MDQKASQGLLRLGDDLLDERLTVSHGGRTREGNERAEAGRQGGKTPTPEQRRPRQTQTRQIARTANIPQIFLINIKNRMGTSSPNARSSGLFPEKFKLGKPNGRQT